MLGKKKPPPNTQPFMQCCWLRKVSIWNRLLIQEVVFVPVHDAGKKRQDWLFPSLSNNKLVPDPQYKSVFATIHVTN